MNHKNNTIRVLFFRNNPVCPGIKICLDNNKVSIPSENLKDSQKYLLSNESGIGKKKKH